MSVCILSPDPTLRLLLAFALRFQGFDVAEATCNDGLPVSGAAASPHVLLVDLSDEGESPHVAAMAQRYPPFCLRVVLSKPGPVMASARQLLPDAAVYLPVPVVPAHLGACVRMLSAAAAVQGYAFASPSLTVA